MFKESTISKEIHITLGVEKNTYPDNNH